MDNPFSAPVSKVSTAQGKSTPPPLEEVEPREPIDSPAASKKVQPPVRSNVEVASDKAEIENEIPAPELEPSSSPSEEGIAVKSETTAVETSVPAPEFAESKFDLEDEESDSKAFSVKRAIESAPKPKPTPISQSQSPEFTVASHHQPTAYVAPEGWSDADFDSHDDSELPALTMEEKSCRMCKYFHFEDALRSDVRFGECRRSAPVGVGKAVWPSVLWESWCGEWQMGVGQEEIMQMARSVADSAAFKNS